MAPLTNTEQYMEALAFATKAHEGQKYADEPYVNHPIRVSGRVLSPVGKVVALLHDTIEDCGVTEEELAALFGSEVAEAVAMLSRPEGVEYADYIAGLKAAGNATVIEVKLADLAENLTDMPENKQKLRTRYEAAVAVLTS